MCPAITGAREQYPTAGPPVPGKRATSCAHTPISTAEDPALSYREKDGHVWGLGGTRCADAVDGIRSMLDGTSSFHTV